MILKVLVAGEKIGNVICRNVVVVWGRRGAWGEWLARVGGDWDRGGGRGRGRRRCEEGGVVHDGSLL